MVDSGQWSVDGGQRSVGPDKSQRDPDQAPTTNNQQPTTAVLGYGNELRGDDALGRVAARHLARRFAGVAGIDVLDVHQLTPDLAEVVKDYERVILIDARAGEPPGVLYEQRVAPATALPHPFSHYVSAGELLAVTMALYEVRPEMVLVGISAASFDVGDQLSPAVAAALPRLLARVEGLLGRATPPP